MSLYSIISLPSYHPWPSSSQSFSRRMRIAQRHGYFSIRLHRCVVEPDSLLGQFTHSPSLSVVRRVLRSLLGVSSHLISRRWFHDFYPTLRTKTHQRVRSLFLSLSSLLAFDAKRVQAKEIFIERIKETPVDRNFTPYRRMNRVLFLRLLFCFKISLLVSLRQTILRRIFHVMQFMLAALHLD